MNRRYISLAVAIGFAALFASCRQLYTTSLGSALARDSISIPNSTSIKGLLEIADSNGSDPDVAAEILSVLAGKNSSDILALSSDDKTTVFNLATNAAIDMGSVTDLANSISSGGDSNSLISSVFSSFDTSVDMTAILTLLSDQTTVEDENIPIDSIIFASSVVLAGIAEEVGADNLMGYLAGGDMSALSTETQTEITSMMTVSTWLATRSDADTSIVGFTILDLLEGNQ